MEQRLTELWYRESAPPPRLLQPLSWLYGAVMRARSGAYSAGLLRTHRVGRPVVVVGNLTVGGTGKTPLVIWLAQQLTERGLKVGIVSRGYSLAPNAYAGQTRGVRGPRSKGPGGEPSLGAQTPESGGEGGIRTQRPLPGARSEVQERSPAAPRLVRPDSSWELVGDEPVLLQRRTGCPTVVARDRVAGAQALVNQGADVILADDGLQHLRLARDCEIVVIDGSRGFGNGHVLPAGPLRESVSRLGRADAVVVNGTPEHASLVSSQVPSGPPKLQMTLVAGAARRVDHDDVSRPLDQFRGSPVHAVAGIGNPARFFRDLRGQGLDVIEHAFADHHPFAPHDLAFGDGFPVLMTEKDAVKCRTFADPRLWYIPVAACFNEAHARELLEHVMRRIGSFSSAGRVGG